MSECTFLELRCKEVVNVVDGRRLGHIIDMVFELHSGRILGLVVPATKGFWSSMFKGGHELFIPYERICKVGSDTILVELFSGHHPGVHSNAIVEVGR